MSPMVGSEIYVLTGKSSGRTCDIVSMFNFGFLVILFIFNGGPMVLSENKKFKKMLQSLNPSDI